MIDTHLHLTDPKFDPDREAVIARAHAAGVRLLVDISDESPQWEASIALAERYPQIVCSLGQHPHFANHVNPALWDRLRALARRPRVVAIGEIGLDYYRSTTTKEAQIACFRQGLAVARDLQKPVVLHCREAFPDLLEILHAEWPKTGSPGGVVHCFSGDASVAEQCLALGFFLGVDGPITYPNAHRLREIIKQVPLERLVLETDAPYLPPQRYRGQRNEPAYLSLIAEAVATLKGVPVEKILSVTTENARGLYQLSREMHRTE
ncbi:MAG: TatD family hydrolase [Elusimicrobia bacterium]|nr:TatD family hydrolase [Elusimicrobiota bacterium]